MSESVRHEALNLIDGEWVPAAETSVLPDKFTGEPIIRLHHATPELVDRAVGAVATAQAEIDWPPADRAASLTRAADLVGAQAEQLAQLMVDDTGFTITDARGEVGRTRQTLLLSATAATQLEGEMVPIDAAPGIRNRMGFTYRAPIGVVGAVTPFNSPLNTVTHKIAPALAAGNGVVLKPAELAPASANALMRVLLDAGVPAGLLALVHGPGETVGHALIHDQRIGFLTFTGSTDVGRIIQEAAGIRPTQLELGSIASTIICADADIMNAAAKTVVGALRKAGQVCTSVQRLYVQRGIADTFLDAVIAELSRRKVGDPRSPDTLVGPMISLAAAERVEAWLDAALEGGAKILYGGGREGTVHQPTVVTDVPAEADLMRCEVFGPVVCVVPFDELDEAVRDANATPFGLAAGIFTRDISTALRTAQRMRFGGVHINETSASRVDVMPFGGVKASGHGREGPWYAAREMTEERLITISY